ncbi:hypothetical protein N7453_005937 [Penicillium expansum]|nr:hypothetical protein N7453_005937 [Penicillium expansum]
MAAQLVLSQLHRVQRLVNTLCRRFTLHGDREGNPSWTPSTMPTTTGSDRPAHMESLYPFPNLLFEHVEKDVRKRLRSLSAELLEMLRY